MARLSLVASIVVAAFVGACNPDGACAVPPAGEIRAMCLDINKKSCAENKGEFTAGKKCTEVGYKLCRGAFYKPDSDMCSD
jgi:hypothetical protein